MAALTGISSTCWDSIAEVTALAMNSSPAKALQNTCAGIGELHIFQLPVRVYATSDQDGGGEHLELVVDEDNQHRKLITINQLYGTMPSSE